MNRPQTPLISDLEIVPLESLQIKEAIAILSDAFANDPDIAYLASENELVKQKIIRCISRATIDYSFPLGQIHTTSKVMKGVAIWLPPGTRLNNFRLLLAGLYKLPFYVGFKLPSLLSAQSKIEAYHDRDVPEPHWYLRMLGVASNYQGQGIGSQLLQPILDRADLTGTPCYLETSTEAAVRFYQRHGFTVIRTEKLAEDAPYFWTMKREP